MLLGVHFPAKEKMTFKTGKWMGGGLGGCQAYKRYLNITMQRLVTF